MRGKLSPRERQILEGLAQGKSSQEVARDLSISENTVKAHLTRVFQKLGATNRTEAVARFLNGGEGSTRPPGEPALPASGDGKPRGPDIVGDLFEWQAVSPSQALRIEAIGHAVEQAWETVSRLAHRTPEQALSRRALRTAFVYACEAILLYEEPSEFVAMTQPPPELVKR